MFVKRIELVEFLSPMATDGLIQKRAMSMTNSQSTGYKVHSIFSFMVLSKRPITIEIEATDVTEIK